MDNSSLLQSNMTQVSIPPSELVKSTRLTFIFLIIVGFGFFTYFITVIQKVFFKTPHIWDNARYILFVYMLTNDTYFLISVFLLLLGAIYEIYVPASLCFLHISLSGIAFRASPCSLAAMAVEQYIAICYPLRHMELYSTFRAHMTFAMIWLLLAVPYVVELCIMFSSRTNIFHLYIICRYHFLVVNAIQLIINTSTYILCFTSAALVLLVTYVKIMLVVYRVSSQSPLESKAGKTIMLHAFQLLLCMTSLLSKFTETIEVNQAELLPISNFFLFTCIPRFLSPVIYGFRDETLRKYVKTSLSFIHKCFGTDEAKVPRNVQQEPIRV